jgi:hypothetical protein
VVEPATGADQQAAQGVPSGDDPVADEPAEGGPSAIRPDAGSSQTESPVDPSGDSPAAAEPRNSPAAAEPPGSAAAESGKSAVAESDLSGPVGAESDLDGAAPEAGAEAADATSGSDPNTALQSRR